MLGFFSSSKKGGQVNATGASAGVALTPELINEILSRLPVKTVGRFRSACKHWHSLLNNSQFLKLQFSRNKDSNKLIFACKYNSFCTVDFCKGSCSSCDRVSAIGKLLNFKHCDLNNYEIHGSCNGLLLLSDCTMDYLWIVNPVTRATRRLPSCIDRIYADDEYAFGYDSSKDDYVVVMLLISVHRSYDNRYAPWGTVCVFRENRWERVQKIPSNLVGSPVVFVNGAIHWLGYRNFNCVKSRVIYKFDLADEKVREVEQPECFKEESRLIMDVNVLGGCLYLLVSNQCNSKSLVEIWMMKEYGVRQSWTKLSVFQSLNRYAKPLYIWDGRDAFMVMPQENKLVLCNLRKETSKEIDIQGQILITPEYPYYSYNSLWTFVDSLVLPN